MKDYIFSITKRKGRPFRILNLTDIQLHDGVKPDLTVGVIRQLIEKTSPDLIVHLGDIIDDSPEFSIKRNLKTVLDCIDSYGIPWTTIFGNHDHDYCPISWFETVKDSEDKWLAEQFMTRKNCLFAVGPENVDGIGNFVINIKEETGEIFRSLYFFDTMLAGVNETHTAFYRDMVAESKRSNGGKDVSSIVFVHIALPEWRFIQDEQAEKDWKDCRGGVIGRIKNDLPCGTPSFFNAIKELGMTKTVVCGHDHENAYVYDYQGVQFIISMKSSDGCNHYKYGGIGGSLLTLDGNDDKLEYLFADIKDEWKII